jgi:hypothetical protein
VAGSGFVWLKISNFGKVVSGCTIGGVSGSPQLGKCLPTAILNLLATCNSCTSLSHKAIAKRTLVCVYTERFEKSIRLQVA